MLYQVTKSWQKDRASCKAPNVFRELGAVLERFELGLGVGVVGAGVGSGMGFGDPEVGQEKGDGLRSHGGSAIGVDGQLAGKDLLLSTGDVDQPLGEGGALPCSHHPSDGRSG